MPYKEILSAIAIIITFIAFLPYIISILKGKTKPHVFSWLIWGITTFIVFLAQLEANGGVGAWPIGVSGVITLFIALLAFIKKADIKITRMDWVFFVSAISSLPFWFYTSNPLWAVIILTTVDISGFAPTVRKTYNDPYSESLLFFMLFAIRNILVITALETLSVTTTLFPAVIALACFSLIIMILYRRLEIKNANKGIE
ncbi:MAG: hypothetical protein DIZ80_16830 [endosymbiont of Galathealinum brachiosum]|uniref:Uncharacterized protein n=1 Tax=endosymbiont of Galathealinum brachiosum TaxID=2200906 RepID=A0A370D6P0_9GAMM|nr:MAG: hypothetical protein DIZ80_16830 [endosymbiont of Galathealinum brachiosum]